MKYKVGDKVRIAPDLKQTYDQGIYGLSVNDLMPKYKGKLATIVDTESNYYLLDIDKREWGWTEKMLVPPSHTTAKQDRSNRVKLGRWGMRYKETRIG